MWLMWLATFWRKNEGLRPVFSAGPGDLAVASYKLRSMPIIASGSPSGRWIGVRDIYMDGTRESRALATYRTL